MEEKCSHPCTFKTKTSYIKGPLIEYGSQWRSMLNFGSHFPPKMDISLVRTGNVIYHEELLNPWSGHDPVSQLMGTRQELEEDSSAPVERDRNLKGAFQEIREQSTNF